MPAFAKELIVDKNQPNILIVYLRRFVKHFCVVFLYTYHRYEQHRFWKFFG